MRPRVTLGWPWKQTGDSAYALTLSSACVVAAVRPGNNIGNGEEGWRWTVNGSGGGWKPDVQDAIEAAEDAVLARLRGLRTSAHANAAAIGRVLEELGEEL